MSYTHASFLRLSLALSSLSLLSLSFSFSLSQPRALSHPAPIPPSLSLSLSLPPFLSLSPLSQLTGRGKDGNDGDKASTSNPVEDESLPFHSVDDDDESKWTTVVLEEEGSLGLSFAIEISTCLAVVGSAPTPIGAVEKKYPGAVREGDILRVVNGHLFEQVTSFDADGDGKIDIKELEAAMKTTDLKEVFFARRPLRGGMDMSDAEVAGYVLKYFDSDDSGELNEGEVTAFLEMMLTAIITKIAKQPRPLTLKFQRGHAHFANPVTGVPSKHMLEDETFDEEAEERDSEQEEGGGVEGDRRLCATCGGAFLPGTNICNIGGKPYHLACAVCADCKVDISSGVVKVVFSKEVRESLTFFTLFLSSSFDSFLLNNSFLTTKIQSGTYRNCVHSFIQP